MTVLTSGSCLCGTVRFEIRGPFERFFLCHCSRCRKDTGSAHAANLFSASASLVWRAGSERITHYRLPETRHARSFCSLCGSPVPCLQMGVHRDGALLVVPAGSLDVEIANAPDAHVCFASRASWEDRMVAAPKVDDLPG